MNTESRAELTLRGSILGVLITVVFTAANVYFGLKAGLTFSTSIPAAVISMAILRSFRNATVQENNIVQTVASAAGTLSSTHTTSPAALFRMSVTLSTNVVLSVASVPMKATLCTPVVATGKVTLKLPKLALARDTNPPICAPSIEIISGCRYGATQHDRCAAWNDSV